METLLTVFAGCTNHRQLIHGMSSVAQISISKDSTNIFFPNKTRNSALESENLNTNKYHSMSKLRKWLFYTSLYVGSVHHQSQQYTTQVNQVHRGHMPYMLIKTFQIICIVVFQMRMIYVRLISILLLSKYSDMLPLIIHTSYTFDEFVPNVTR